MDDDARADFLKRLDDAADEVNVTDWEAQFIESNLERQHFSPKQREVIDRLVEKYEDRL